MDLETTQTNTTAKLPILKQGEYDMWKLRIEQYFQVQDYALWDVIENGNSFKPAAQTTTNTEGTSTTLIPGPVTADEKVQKKNDVKEISMLLMALLNEHLLTFNQYKDAKTLFAAIQTRFGGFRRLNKPDLDAISFDDLYNNFKIVEQEVKGTVSSSSQNMAFVSSPSSTNEVNTAYEVSTATTQVSPASTQVSTASTQASTANLSDATVYAFLANQPNGSQLVHEDLEQIHEDDLEEIDLKWQLALLSMKTRRWGVSTATSWDTLQGSAEDLETKTAETGIKTALEGLYMWNKLLPKPYWLLMELVLNKIYMAGDKFPTNMALMALLDSRDTSIKDPKINALKSEIEKLKKEKESNQIKIDKFENASKSLDKLIGSQIFDNSRKGVRFVSYNDVPPPLIGLFAPPTIDLSNSGLEEFQQPEFEGYRPKASKSVCKDTSNEVKKTLDAPLGEKLVSKKDNFDHVQAYCNYHQREGTVNGNNYTRVNYNYSAKKIPRAVLMKTGLKPLNTAKPVNTAHTKTTVYSARPMSCFSKLAQSTVKMPYQSRTTLTNKIFNQKVNTSKEKVYTAKPKVVNTVRPTSAVVNAVRAYQVNVVKGSACWIWRPTKLNSASITFKRQNYIDARGRSKSVMAWVPKGN
ncbi:hypothetical protein Tco_0377968 [Tanacetum coccineum]